ncbi:MAG: hypothetical protein L0H93_16440 [Nocardioides sp.]|nr:hypothetical protein [Nocardioides sp.]
MTENDHDHEEQEISLSVAAQALGDPSQAYTATLSDETPGIHLELVDLASAPASEEDDWELDDDADMGLKVMLGGIDPEVAAQLLRVAADFLDQAVSESE